MTTKDKEKRKNQNKKYYQKHRNDIVLSNKTYRINHKETYDKYQKEYQKEWENRPENREKRQQKSRTLKCRFNQGKAVAKKRQIEWCISFEDYVIIVSEPCFYCQGRFNKPVLTGCGLDRLDSSNSYNKDNIVSCCTQCNQIKGQFLTSEETKVAVEAIFLLRATNTETSVATLNPKLNISEPNDWGKEKLIF